MKIGKRKEKIAQRGSTLIVVVGIALVGAIIAVVVMSTTRMSAKQSGKRRGTVTALNIAEAGREHLIASIVSATFTPVANQDSTALSSISFGGGHYTVVCSANTALDSVWIRSQGTEAGGSAKRLEVITSLQMLPPISASGVRGAVTSRTSVRMNGTVTADGRDWDSTNTAIVGPGLAGVSSCGTITQQSAAVKAGGNGLEPVVNAIIPRIEENVPLTSVPSTLEALTGLTTDELDFYRVDNLPPPPFHGIYYVDHNVGPLDFGNFSSGILIVHNTAGSAVLHANNGYFKGLIVTDLLDKINGNLLVVGGLFTIREGADVETFVTGTATIKYSAGVLNNLHTYASNVRRRVSILSWREIPPI